MVEITGRLIEGKKFAYSNSTLFLDGARVEVRAYESALAIAPDSKLAQQVVAFYKEGRAADKLELEKIRAKELAERERLANSPMLKLSEESNGLLLYEKNSMLSPVLKLKENPDVAAFRRGYTTAWLEIQHKDSYKVKKRFKLATVTADKVVAAMKEVSTQMIADKKADALHAANKAANQSALTKELSFAIIKHNDNKLCFGKDEYADYLLVSRYEQNGFSSYSIDKIRVDSLTVEQVKKVFELLKSFKQTVVV